MRKELKIGLLLMAFSFTLNYIFHPPELIMGFLLGLTLCFELVGALPESVYARMKAAKCKWFHI